MANHSSQQQPDLLYLSFGIGVLGAAFQWALEALWPYFVLVTG